MQLGERVAVRARASASRERALLAQLGSPQRRLDLAQLDVAVEHEIERGPRDGGRLLRDVRDRPARRQVDVAGLLVELAAQQREQARLAAAVRADEADAVARVHGQRGAIEQAQRAAGERQVGESDHGKGRGGP